jgi:sorbitol-specific phosphotransferase system component IIC
LAPLPGVISNGIIPLLILIGLMSGFYLFYLRKQNLTKEELIQSIFVFIITAFTLLTLIGIFFRGKDMALSLPWNVLF